MLSPQVLSAPEVLHIFLGMIRSQVQKIAEKRGITNAYQLQKIADFPIGQAYRIWADDWQQINLRTLDKLCKALRCKPNDLLHYDPDPES